MSRIGSSSSRASRFSRSLEDVFVDDERVARYDFKDFVGQLDLGANMGRYGQARIGYMYDERDDRRGYRLGAHARGQSPWMPACSFLPS